MKQFEKIFFDTFQDLQKFINQIFNEEFKLILEMMAQYLTLVKDLVPQIIEQNSQILKKNLFYLYGKFSFGLFKFRSRKKQTIQVAFGNLDD